MNRSTLLPPLAAAALACVPPAPPPSSTTPQPPRDELPAIQVEAEPRPKPPPLVAPPLPELAPTRPLENLTILLRHTEADPRVPTTYWPVGTTPVAMSADEAAALGLSSALQPTDLGPISARADVPFFQAGPLTLVHTAEGIRALEAGGAVRWSAAWPEGGRNYAQLVTPRVFVAHVYASQTDHVIAWSLDDGRQLWDLRGDGALSFNRVHSMWADDERAYFRSGIGVVAFDPNFGAVLWTTPSEVPCGAIAGEGLVVIEHPEGHRLLEAELGRERERFAALPAARCSWTRTTSGLAPAALSGGRLYAFDSAADSSPLRAIDLETRAQLWETTGVGGAGLAVDHDAVYLAGDPQTLVALDVDTGKPRASLSIGASFRLQVEPVGGPAGPLVLVHDTLGGLWVLGRAAQPPTLEDYVIRGTLVPSGHLHKRDMSSVRLKIGDQIVETDSRGRFTARGRASGAVSIKYAGRSSGRDLSLAARRVVLDGSGVYKINDLTIREVFIE